MLNVHTANDRANVDPPAMTCNVLVSPLSEWGACVGKFLGLYTTR